MQKNQLTAVEQELFQRLPGPPALAVAQTNNVCIIEWLPADDLHTGRMLHDWMKQKRAGWSSYTECRSGDELVASIENAAQRASETNAVPILHVEAHGANAGLEGPNGHGGSELLDWSALTDGLQHLNTATRCNLIVVVAACTGFAGIQAFMRGPRAPAVALVGPDAPVMPKDLLFGTKEFYRRLMDDRPNLGDIASSASEQAGTISFAWEPFAVLAFESLIEALIISMRQSVRRQPRARMHQRAMLQCLWDEMFMIDLYPENRKRFGVDMSDIITQVADAQALGPG